MAPAVDLTLLVNWKPSCRCLRRLDHWSRRHGCREAVRRRIAGLDAGGRLFRAWSFRRCGSFLLCTPRLATELHELLADLRYAPTTF